MRNAICPTVDVLSAFAVGRTTDDEALAIETHLAACPECVAMLDRATSDPLVAAVRASLSAVQNASAHSTPEPIQIEFPGDERAQTTQVYVDSPSNTETSSPRATTNEATEELYRFLSPSSEPGAIGWLGPYRILEQLGRGGMGAVFRAEDPQLQRPVALKVMRPHALGAPEASQRFLAEARAAAKLKHDHVVTIYQVGEDRGVAFIAMELLEGESLDTRLGREGRLSIDDACRIGMEIASALSAAHAAGLIHRDIKPANLWLDSSSGRTKVLDFGLARATDADINLTSSGAILGTPAYMAPEQARGEPVDGRTDLFALGVVLYRAITGQLPFRGANSMSTLLAVTTQTPPSPRAVCPDVPQQLSDLVMHLLAKQPAQRPASAAAVVSELSAIRRTANEPPEIRRRTWGTAVAACAALLLIIAAVIVIIRDKNGNKVAEFTVANGTTAEIRTDTTAPAPKTVVTTPNPGAAEKTAQEGKKPPPFDVPPTLEEWLKDRTVITVAQDGSGQFTTIQAAFHALRPGQAIRVQGPGPYREHLNISELPPDSGVFSTSGAVIECTEWQEAYKETDAAGEHQVYTGHILGHPQGFRLHGLTFTFPPRSRRHIQRMTIPFAQNLIIEECIIRATDGGEHQFINITNFGGPLDPPLTANVRNCVIESQLWFSTATPQSNILIEKNLFLGPADQEHLVIADANLAAAVIRNNVFAGNSVGSITIARLKHCDNLEVVNNSLGGHNGLFFLRSCPEGATIRNNLHFGSGSFVVLIEGAQEQRGRLFQREAFDHNAYHTLIITSTGPIAPRQMLGDYIGAVKFLSNDLQNRDYLRVSNADKSLSEDGAGGDQASYIGALPAGPIGPHGDWFTQLQERWKKSAGNSEPASAPLLNAPELSEWLKGRTILTVSQDGKGQFKSIQDALNQVASGQAVEVLDRGPYHERLSVTLPADCGLFSRVQTMVDFPNWEFGWTDPVGINGKPAQTYLGHDFIGTDRFRLRGFDFHFPALKGTYEEGHWHQRLCLRMPRNCVVENCLVRRAGTGARDGEPFVVSDWDSPDSAAMSIVLRDCVIDGALAVNTKHSKPLAPGVGSARVFLQRLCFPGAGMHHHLLTEGNALKQLVVRDCIFAGAPDANVLVDDCDLQAKVEITNCYLDGDRGIWFNKSAPETGVVIRNNLRTGDGIVYFDETAGKFRDQVQQTWQVDHNAYGMVKTPNTPPISLRQSATDIITQPMFLATSFGEPNAFRITSEDRLGKSGAGETLPAYIGPFPPGPAPATGDWFTRLQKLWFDGSPPIAKQASTPIVEPAPLDEWLQGRTILTVAQDGSGQFKTIQAALNALQSGQVVKVLDRGPYRERIELQSPLDDIGIISTVQTRIDLTDLAPVGGDIQSRGHFVNKANRLRIHGFEFQIPQAPANSVTIGIHVSGSRAVVFEHCAVRRANSPESQSLVVGGVRGDLDEPTVVRECYIEQGMQIYTLGPDGSAIVARNYFTGELHGLMAGGAFQQCVIRNNIFSGTLKFPFIQHVVHADWFELSNNTFFSFPETVLMESLASAQLHERAIRELKGEKNPQLSVDRGHAPTGQGAIYNNLHNRPGFLNVTGGAEDEPWTWQVGYNCYPGDRDIPARNALPRDTNVLANPIFYSVLPHDRDFARLKPDSPGATSRAGEKWPNYTGALPPGPVPADGDWFTRIQQRWMKQE